MYRCHRPSFRGRGVWIDYRKEKGTDPEVRQEVHAKIYRYCPRRPPKECAPQLSLRGQREEGGKDGGQLVLLGFGVASFTPEAYRRRSLRRPCEI